MELSRTISKGADLGGKDPDHVVELCNEVGALKSRHTSILCNSERWIIMNCWYSLQVVQEGQSVLIFCSSRKGCESTAKHVAKFLKRFTSDINEKDCEFADITSAINSLRKCPAGLDPILEETLPAGVAFHHAGLTVIPFFLVLWFLLTLLFHPSVSLFFILGVEVHIWSPIYVRYLESIPYIACVPFLRYKKIIKI